MVIGSLSILSSFSIFWSVMHFWFQHSMFGNYDLQVVALLNPCPFFRFEWRYDRLLRAWWHVPKEPCLDRCIQVAMTSRIMPFESTSFGSFQFLLSCYSFSGRRNQRSLGNAPFRGVKPKLELEAELQAAKLSPLLQRIKVNSMPPNPYYIYDLIHTYLYVKSGIIK